MAIITLARQAGSGGQSIAAALTEQLGYRQYGRREVRQIATSSGLELPESFERFANEDVFQNGSRERLSHLHISYGELEFDRALRGYGPSPEPGSDSDLSFLDGLTRHRRDILLGLLSVVYQLAANDNAVLVGAGGQLLLAETPGVLRIKIVAPVEIRIERLASAYDLTSAEAGAAIRRADQEQRDYNRAVLGADWDDPLMWDVVANTERFSVDDIRALVTSMLAGPRFAAGLSPATRALLAAAAALNRAIWADSRLRATSIMAAPAANGLALRGEVVSEQTRQWALALAAATAPNITILDEMQVLTHFLPQPSLSRPTVEANTPK